MADITDLVDTAIDLIGDVAGPYVLIAQAGTSIGGIIPDVSIQETISDENTITAHPVQSGTPVSDHVFANPVVCDLVAAWSDSGFSGYPGRSQDLYQLILSLRDSRQPFDIYTTKRMLPSMVFGNITSTTDETNGSALFLRVRLQQITISDTSSTGTPATSDNQQFPSETADTTNMGNVALQPWNGPGLTPIGTVAGGV